MSSTTIDPEDGKKLLGEKLGTTKGNIDEWSKQEEYSKEFASTVGIQDVYTVKGYDKDFRIMTYLENDDGTSYPQFYDCLNGITVKNLDLLNKFFGEVNRSNPYLLEDIESTLGDYQNDEQYREFNNMI